MKKYTLIEIASVAPPTTMNIKDINFSFQRIIRLPPSEKFSDAPEKQKSQRRASRIEQHVPNRSLARGYEELVKLVTRRVERRDAQSHDCVEPIPGTAVISEWLAPRAPKQHRENRVFNRMGTFANRKNDFANSLIGKRRKQPMNDWPENS